MSFLCYGQNPKFPHGVYYANPSDSVLLNFARLNTIQNALYSGNYSDYYNTSYSLILGKSTNDLNTRHYAYFTGGHYSKWEFEDVDRSPGFDYNDTAGTITTAFGEGCWTNEGQNYDDWDNVITGPYFAQEKSYSSQFFIPEEDDSLEYYFQVRFRVDIEEPDTTLESSDLMRFDFLYGYYDENTDYTVDTLREPLFLTSQYDGQGFVLLNDSVKYAFEPRMNSIGTEPADYGDQDYDPSPNSDNYNYCGFFIEADFMESSGKNYNVYLDYFEIYCETIGEDLLTSSLQTSNKLAVKNSIEAFNIGDVDILSWRGYSEVIFIDLFRPFGITHDYMEDISSSYKAPLTQVYNPVWRIINGENRLDRMERYLDLAEPSVLTTNHYPIGSDITTEQLKILRFKLYNDVLKKAGEELIDRDIEHVSIVQAHSWAPFNLVQPAPNELEAMVNLSLANGATSIQYFKWRGNSPETGILNYNGDTTAVYTRIREKIGPKLNDESGATEFGDALLNMEMRHNLISYWNSPADTIYENIDSLSWVNVDLTESDTAALFIREFIDDRVPQGNPDMYCLYLVNSRVYYSTGSQLFELEIETPYENYSNVRIIDVEGGLDTCFAESIDLDWSINYADGRLWRFVPVISSGGKLYDDDEVATDIALTEELTISNGSDLTISAEYTVEEDITIGSGSSIIISAGGDIILDGGSLYFPSWDSSLVIMEHNNHPKLVWGVNTWIDSLYYYKIYRKTGTGTWSCLAQADSNYYIDDELTVYGGSGDSLLTWYKVTAYGIINGRPGESDYSNTVETVVNAGEAQKRNSGNHRLPTVFDLRNNYPNPFNPETKIKFQLPENADISIIIYDILGSRIEVLHSGPLNAGYYEKTFKPEGLASGVYICRMHAPKFNKSIKLIYMK